MFKLSTLWEQKLYFYCVPMHQKGLQPQSEIPQYLPITNSTSLFFLSRYSQGGREDSLLKAKLLT